MHETYSVLGLQILGFPCNNFGGQEPGSSAEITAFKDSKGATFQIFEKLECDNATKTHPLFKELMDKTGGGTLGWNFHKFLCDSAGQPIQRFGPRERPNDFEDIIAMKLKE